MTTTILTLTAALAIGLTAKAQNAPTPTPSAPASQNGSGMPRSQAANFAQSGGTASAPSPEFGVVSAFFGKAGKESAAYALAHRDEFAAALRLAPTIRTKDGKHGRRAAYGLYTIYEKFLAGGGAPIAGVDLPADFHRRTDPARYWRNRATPEELLSKTSLPFGMRYSSAGRFSGEVRTKTQLAIFQQSLGIGLLDPLFCRLVREHVATISDTAAEKMLKAEIAALAKLSASKERDAAVNDYLGILAIRRELAAATK